MIEQLEVRSLLLGARWSCRRSSPDQIWRGMQQIPTCAAPLVRPFASGARLEAHASELLGPDSCLPQAIAMAALLKRHGHGGTLVLGVRPGPSLLAHAWVELHGIPIVGGRERPGLAPIWRGAW